MTDRDPKDTANLKVRMREPLRAALEQAARERGVSMNAEILRRLEASFHQEKIYRGLGGAVLQEVINRTVVGFGAALRVRQATGEPDLGEREVRLAAVVAAIDALLAGADLAVEEAALMIEGLKGRLLSRVASAAARGGPA